MVYTTASETAAPTPPPTAAESYTLLTSVNDTQGSFQNCVDPGGLVSRMIICNLPACGLPH